MLHVYTATLGAFQVHSYLLYSDESYDAVMIDTGAQPDELLNVLTENHLNLKLLLYTHAHLDHVEGHATIRQAYPDLQAWIHPEENFWLDALPMQAQMFGMTVPEQPVIQNHVTPGQVFQLADFSLKALFCPGHTPGGISYFVPEGPFVFTGDSLFANTIGRTDFPKGNHEQLIESIQTQLLPLPDDTAVYSGHGPKTYISREKVKNPYLQGPLLRL